MPYLRIGLARTDSWWVTVTAPANALRPNKVPCGPRSTSIESIPTRLSRLIELTVLILPIDIDGNRGIRIQVRSAAPDAADIEARGVSELTDGCEILRSEKRW